MIRITFKYRIGERVVMRESKNDGKVTAFHVDKSGKISYEVTYADRNWAIFSKWFSPAEIRR